MLSIEFINVTSRKFCFETRLILALNSEKKHVEIASIDNFQLDLIWINNDRHIGNWVLVWLLSNHILYIVSDSKRLEQGEQYRCFYDRFSVLKLSYFSPFKKHSAKIVNTHLCWYLEILNSKVKFYDVITN